jgi:acetyl-CoA carboxylase carboxyl transferase subunit beta
MSWFRRVKEGISTATKDKKETPDGLWTKCPQCAKRHATKVLAEHFNICDGCGYHFQYSSEDYFQLLFDEGHYSEINDHLSTNNPLKFEDQKSYDKRLREARNKTKLQEAMRTAYGRMNGQYTFVGAMDFQFIGGSMGVVVGEKICRAADYCLEHRMPLVLVSKSGGARMMEAAFSLMQMARTAAKLAQLGEAQLPYISVLTDPTTGGVTASYAMLGDINVAEPGALIGFAGPRVIKETIGKELPDGFQRSEFLLEHGFLDAVFSRDQLKSQLSHLLQMLLYDSSPSAGPRQLGGGHPFSANGQHFHHTYHNLTGPGYK